MATLLPIARFRVQNFKCVEDSGWIDVDPEVTSFVGKNESGKSALLKALYKLNPVDGEQPVPLREFPRARYAYEFASQDWPIVSAEFELTDEVKARLQSEVSAGWEPTFVRLTRYYSGRRAIEWNKGVGGGKSGSWLARWIGEVRKKVEAATSTEAGDQLAGLKQRVSEALGASAQTADTIRDLHSDEGRALVEQVRQFLASSISEPWTREILTAHLEGIQKLTEEVAADSPNRKALKIVDDYLPVFIYFEDYSVLDDTLVISDFVTQWNANPHDSNLRTKMALFKHVGLDVNEIATLGRETAGVDEDTLREQKDERFIKLSSASQAMTERFGEWWGQRRHSFRYQADGDYFRIWVSDERSAAEIELDQRSRGLRWFFSFYLVFLVEAEEGHRNAILLLDEPGLHLHATAQSDLIRYFDRLSRENQVLYTTHSPFLVDGDRLDRARVVRELDDGSTEVSAKVWPNDKDALLPLQAALGYKLAQTMFLGQRNIVVEGITDFWLLKAMSHVLARAGRASLPDDVVITPAGGAKEVGHFASLFLSNDVKILTLFDGDTAGKRYARDLQRGLFADSDEQIVFVGDAVGNDELEVEDLVPRDYYLDAAAKANASTSGLRGAIRLSNGEAANVRVLDALGVYSERTGKGPFDHAVTAMLLVELWRETEPKDLPAELLDSFEQLFRLMTEALGRLE